MTIARSIASPIARSIASPLDGAGGILDAGPIVNHYMQFNGTSDYIDLPAYTHSVAAGTMLIRCKLDVASPVSAVQAALVEWCGPILSTYYTYPPSGQAYVSVFRTTRMGPYTLSASVPRTDWHWFIVRDNAANGWELLQAKDDGTLYSIATAAHEAWSLTMTRRRIAANNTPHFFDGGIDRAALFDARMDDTALQSFIAGGNGPSGCIWRFEMDAVSGSSLLDVSGNDRHGTIVGSPVITEF